MHWLLIVVTYLGGSTWGPIVQTQNFATKQQCEMAAKAVVEQVDDMSKTNATSMGQAKNGVSVGSGRQLATTSCHSLDIK